MDLPNRISRTGPFSILGVLDGIFHFYSKFDRNMILLANSENPDQTPRSVTFCGV